MVLIYQEVVCGLKSGSYLLYSLDPLNYIQKHFLLTLTHTYTHKKYRILIIEFFDILNLKMHRCFYRAENYRNFLKFDLSYSVN